MKSNEVKEGTQNYHQFIIKNMSKLHHLFWVEISGDSMLPQFYDGEIIKVLPIKEYTAEIKTGDIIVYAKFATRLTVHRVIEILSKDGYRQYQTKGDNNFVKDKYIVNHDEVVGIVIL